MALVAVLLAGMALASLPAAHAASVSFNNVQVFVNTQYTADYNYFFTAYNTTGQLVASSNTPYPAASFELPAGSYLITVSAINQTYYGCYACVKAGASNGYASGAPGSTTSTGDTGPMPPIYYRPPTSEYGYQVVQVTGPLSINIDTTNTTQFPTQQVTVKVSYVNGTAAEGAWVSASVVGQWYYWWGSDAGMVMSAQTGADGTATLVIPKAPAVISAWDWVQVKMPADNTTKQVNVGGQTVTVTMYWQPMYVGLAASGLVIPPATSIDLVLNYQPYNYWVMPMGAQVTPGVASDSSAPSVSKGETGVPSGTQQAADISGASNQYFLPTNIPSLQTPTGTQASTVGMTSLLEGLALGAAATAVGAFSILRLRRKTP